MVRPFESTALIHGHFPSSSFLIFLRRISPRSPLIGLVQRLHNTGARGGTGGRLSVNPACAFRYWRSAIRLRNSYESTLSQPSGCKRFDPRFDRALGRRRPVAPRGCFVGTVGSYGSRNCIAPRRQCPFGQPRLCLRTARSERRARDQYWHNHMGWPDYRAAENAANCSRIESHQSTMERHDPADSERP